MMDLWATVPYYTAYLAKALRAQGVPVQVGAITYYLDPSCFHDRGLSLDPGLSDLVGRFSLPRVLRRPLKLAEGLLNLAALSIRFLFRPPQIVHVQFLPLLRSRLPVDHWFVRLCRRRGSRIVLTVHDLLPHDTAARYHDLYQRLYRTMDALICHSDHIKERLVKEFGVPAGRIAVIPHGPFFFDLPEQDPAAARQQLGVPAQQQMVLWQGIIFPYKGVDLLLEAWRRVEVQRTDLCLVILGTGDPSLTATLQQQAQQLGLRSVRFHLRFCSTQELVAAYRAALVVIYPYRAITTSGALATGIALGTPVIASDLPVFRELLEPGEGALLVPPGDTDRLAAAIVAIAGDPALRDRLAATMRARNFGPESWTAIATQTRDIYVKLAAGLTSIS
jgi:glycosyltransferase involved in cell wall biosynthesis